MNQQIAFQTLLQQYIDTILLHEKNDFAEIFKNLAKYRFRKTSTYLLYFIIQERFC